MTTENPFTKSTADFLAEKIKYHEYEIALAKKELALITSPVPVIADPKDSDAPKLPSNAAMVDMIKQVLAENPGQWIKNSTVVNRFYYDHIRDVENREFKQNITRRLSGVLAGMVKDGTLGSKKKKGERGDMYMSAEDYMLS